MSEEQIISTVESNVEQNTSNEGAEELATKFLAQCNGKSYSFIRVVCSIMTRKAMEARDKLNLEFNCL